MHVAWGQQLEPTQVLTASGEYYATLGVTAAIGRTFSDSDDRIGGGREGRVAVISDAAWRRRYGADPAVIGRTVRIGPDTLHHRRRDSARASSAWPQGSPPTSRSR